MFRRCLSSLMILPCLAVPGAAGDLQPLLDKLADKGVLSRQESQELQERMKENRSPSLPFSLRPGGRIQLRFSAQENDPNGKEKEDSFRIRRARLSLDGTLVEDVDFHLEADVAREAALEEAEIRLLYLPWAAVTAGQFKTPFSLENLTSAKRLDMVERSEAVTALSPDKEIGLMVGGRFFRNRFSYRTSLTNGNGKNKKMNDNDQFLYVLRLEWTAFPARPLPGGSFTAALGANAAFSRDSEARAEEIFGVKKALGTASEGDRRLAGGDVAVRWGRASFKAEYLYGNFKPSNAKLRQINAAGYYLQGGLYLAPSVQALVRYETYDPDRQVSDNSDLRWTTLGANYFIKGYDLRLQANYIFKEEDGTKIRNDAFFLMLQLLI